MRIQKARRWRGRRRRQPATIATAEQQTPSYLQPVVARTVVFDASLRRAGDVIQEA